MTKLTGRAYFNWLQNPQPASGKFPASYSTQVVLDAPDQKKAKELGLKLKPKTEKIPGPYVKVTSYVKEEDHKKYVTERGRRPQVFLGKTLYTGPVWDGSKVNIIFGTKQYDGEAKAILRAVQILELAPAPEGYEENSGLNVDVQSELDDVEINVDTNTELNDNIDDL